LRQEIEILSQTFGRTLDRKDAMLRALATDLDEADQQTLRAAQTHAEKVDQLVVFHNSLVDKVRAFCWYFFLCTTLSLIFFPRRS
jgi:hypothetical protein